MTNHKHLKNLFSAACLVFMTAAFTFVAEGQGRYANVYSNSDVGGFVANLENSSDNFRRDFDQALDNSSVDGTGAEDRLNNIVANFENSVDRLRGNFDRQNSWWQSRSQVQDMMTSARSVNTMMNTLQFRRNIERQWNALRRDINKLADTYELNDLDGRGGGNGGGGGIGGGGATSQPPAWARGTFYSSNITGYTMTINANGRVTLEGDGQTSYGRYNNGSVYINNDVFPVTRTSNGMRARNRSTGQTTEYSRNNFGGGIGDGGGNGTRPPDWARGTFYSTNITGYTMTVDSNGRVTLQNDGRTSYGRYERGSIYINNDEFPVTRTSSGMRALNRGTGQSTDYSRSGSGSGSGYGNDTGYGDDRGEMSSPPNWARGTFDAVNFPGITMSVDTRGNVTLNNNGQTSYGRYFRQSIYINNEVFPVSQSGRNMRALNQSTGQYTIYRRR